MRQLRALWQLLNIEVSRGVLVTRLLQTPKSSALAAVEQIGLMQLLKRLGKFSFPDNPADILPPLSLPVLWVV